MTVFVDANVVLYAARRDDRYGGPCARILEDIVEGRVDGRTSTAVIEEILHLELSRSEDGLEGLAEVAYTMLTPLLPVTDDIVRTALELRLPALGANDRVHVATCSANGIDAIVTADRGFEGIDGLRRIDPLDGDALATLAG